MRKIYFASGIVCAALFSACSDFDFDKHRGVFKSEEYDANFKEMIGGEVHPAQDWGFGSTRALTRGNAGNGDLGNQTWKDLGADDLENIQDDERRAVLEEIKKKVTGKKISEDVVFPWTDYFLQDVVSGVNGDFEGAGQNGTTSASYCFEAYSKGEFCDPGGQYNNGDKHYQGGWSWNTNSPVSSTQEEYETEHANYAQVANSGHITNMYVHENEDKSQTQIKETALMTNMEYGTYEEMKGRQFRWYVNCHGYRHWSEYIVVNWNGNYYICFDFACGYPENDYDGHPEKEAEHNDWDYNDWVLKITPAGNQPDVWTGDKDPGEEEIPLKWRIMAEDLGMTDDFDFNDVVFDAGIGERDGVRVARIRLLAAGGTLPLYIGEINEEYEVHHQFKVGTNVMVNTADYTSQCTPVEFYVPVAASATEADEIPIIVANGKDADHFDYYTLRAEKGDVPQKICVPVETPWSYERYDIAITFPDFKKYAITTEPQTWMKNIDEKEGKTYDESKINVK